MADIRKPTQKRSIEKRNKIIEKGFELICEKGYYNTNTNEIAQYADVSTGLVYQYFNDKKEIFLEGVKNYSTKILYPMLTALDNKKFDINNLNSLLKDMLNSYKKSHTISKKAHEELMAMTHLDEDVGNIFKNTELEMTEKLVQIFEINNIKLKNPKEKVHIIIGIIDNFCHEIVYHQHENINYEEMENEVIEIILNILKK